MVIDFLCALVCLPACSEYSKQLNEMRLKVLTAKEASIQEILHEAKTKLKDVSKNTASYKKLVQDLTVQVGPHCMHAKARHPGCVCVAPRVRRHPGEHA